MTTGDDQQRSVALAVAQGDLQALLAARQAAWDGRDRNPSLARLRPGPLKQHRKRTDAEMRREKARDLAIQAAEQKIARLKRDAAKADRAPVTVEEIATAGLVQVDSGTWYRVVKVNRATVKVLVEPGMDDLIKVGRIVRAVHRDEVALTEARMAAKTGTS